MATKTDRYLIFLMSAVVAADARPNLGSGPALSIDKQIAMEAKLAERFPEVSAAVRRRLVKRVLSGMPTLTGGLSFLATVEKSSARLKETLEGPKEAAAVVRGLIEIALADGVISRQERLVLQAVIANIGLRGRARLAESDGKARLARL